MKRKNIVRFVNFQIVIYDLRKGNKLTIIPVTPQNKGENNIHMGMEIFLIETHGVLDKANIHEDTLSNFANFLSDYL